MLTTVRLGRVFGAPTESDPAGADELLETVRTHELLERVDLLGVPDDLEDDRVDAQVRDAGVERLRERRSARPDGLEWRQPS